MMTGRRVGAALAAAALIGVAAAGPAAAAPTQDPASCAGVWVVVEGQGAGCASGYSTGQEALASAGFATQDSSPGLLCRIDEQPQTCSVTPSGYWSYWQATRDASGGFGAWTYSQLGYTTSHPQAGNAEGWVFGDGSQPPAPPCPRPAPRPRHPPTPSPPPPLPSRRPAPTPRGSAPRSPVALFSSGAAPSRSSWCVAGDHDPGASLGLVGMGAQSGGGLVDDDQPFADRVARRGRVRRGPAATRVMPPGRARSASTPSWAPLSSPSGCSSSC
jgi:hypothetical protein